MSLEIYKKDDDALEAAATFDRKQYLMPTLSSASIVFPFQII